ncbi:hypothetical protein [Allopusillimonas ginsengisoli]|uniref:hypothetical protein n=1 Tax=Allopusillimonas ginsengisoli TaxID=453575 RepID=UPI001020EFAB|nr:hypothetical protein [Allopusillimonas ginsengisoli]TEA77269.1 hypothetical protein ERE07_15035 [Allopusillimonas ginsengisoli]
MSTWVNAKPLHDLWASLDNLSTAGFVWNDSQASTVNGVPLRVQLFRSRNSAIEAARLLSGRIDLFQHIVTSPGLIRLSGYAGNAHWLAEIEPVSSGAVGRVSSLVISDATASGSHSPHPAPSPLSWLPAGARRLLHHVADPAGASGPNQSIYAIDMRPAALAAHIASALRKQAWLCETGCSSTEGHQRWRRHGNELFLFIQARAAGAVVYIHID